MRQVGGCLPATQTSTAPTVPPFPAQGSCPHASARDGSRPPRRKGTIRSSEVLQCCQNRPWGRLRTSRRFGGRKGPRRTAELHLPSMPTAPGAGRHSSPHLTAPPASPQVQRLPWVSYRCTESTNRELIQTSPAPYTTEQAEQCFPASPCLP